jgi:hypothetical protein
VTKALLTAVAAAALAAALAPGALAGPCGLPDTRPLWIDYGSPTLKDVFAKPGVIVAASGEGGYPAAMRALGVTTVFWDMYLNRRIGTPSAPAKPEVLEARAESLYDYAVRSTGGCRTPLIAMNEMFGASATTPWTPTQAAYRENLLRWSRLLAAKGAKPVVLVSSRPYTGSFDAAQWWRDLAEVADIVLEKYFAAPQIWRAGPVLGNRRLRTSLRESAAQLFAIGIPPSKIGFMLGFQTRRGAGGREGLEPASAWFQVAKWQALAAKQVAAELGIASIWSWGWGQWDEHSVDPDKAGAACAWLWARDPSLCDAPGTLPRFPDDRTTGQLALGPELRCVFGETRITTNQIGELARVLGDPELALSALYARAVESRNARVTMDEILAAERAVIRRRFGGSRAAYLAALARDRATLGVARGVLADELRRRRLLRRIPARAPAAASLGSFQTTYAETLARQVVTDGRPSWLPEGRGLALAIDAPPEVFRLPEGATRTIATLEGPVRVTVLGEPTPLGALPLDLARPAIRRVLREAARVNAYHDWTTRRQRGALDAVVCRRDRLPQVAAVELTSFLPYLGLSEAAMRGTAAHRR